MKPLMFASLTLALLVAPATSLLAQTAAPTSLNELRNAVRESGGVTGTSFSRDGVFGCTGSAYGAVGAQGPAGAHVPVFDGALFDQQRLLTYKECLLDGIANSAKEATISNLVKSTVEWAQRSNDGQGAFVTDPQAYELAAKDAEVEKFLAEIDASGMPDKDKRFLKEAVLQNYINTTRGSVLTLECPLSEQQVESFRNGRYIAGGGRAAYKIYRENTACNPRNAYLFLINNLTTRLEDTSEQVIADLDRGSGFPSITRDKVIDLGNGQTVIRKEIVTPGYLIAQQLSQVLGTGLRQAESANEIDTLISSALTNLGTRMLTDVNGFSGLATSFGGQPSYVARLAADAANRTREKMVGAAAAILNNTLETERSFGLARGGTVALFNTTQNQLRKWETTCYADMEDRATEHVKGLIEQKVCPQSITDPTVSCPVHIDVTTTYSPDVIIVHAPTANSLIVEGYASRKTSNIQLSINGVEVVETLTPDSDGYWKSDALDISSTTSTTTTISATEFFANGAGTYGPITATVEKRTTANGVEVVLPSELPTVTITAQSNSFTESVTLSRSREHSDAVIASHITGNLARANKEVVDSQKAMTVLVQMREALAAATTTAGQREILDILDLLVSRKLLHSESNVRTAEAQNNDVNLAMQTLLDQTRASWEGSWCKPNNWATYVTQ